LRQIGCQQQQRSDDRMSERWQYLQCGRQSE
jgi:hypothetical protein